MKFIKALLVVMSVVVLGYAVMAKPSPAPAQRDIVAGVPAHGYHWPRTSIDPNINIRYVVTHNSEDSVTAIWLAQTEKVFKTWSAFRPPNMNIDFTKVRCEFYVGACRIGAQPAQSGTMVVEMTNYGDTGWASRTTIWPVGDHIDRALVELNAFYFAANPTTQPYMQGTYCHAVGAALGLDDNVPGPMGGVPDDTCMNYLALFTSVPPYSIPNANDTAELGLVYNHVDPLPSGVTVPDSTTALPVVIDTLPAP